MAQMSPAERADFAAKGGVAGGKARAAKLSKKRLSEIGQLAAKARWEKPQS